MADWGPGSGRDQTGVELNLEWRGARMGSKQKVTLETKS